MYSSLISIFISLSSLYAFNLSPAANYEFRDTTNMDSFFGLSVELNTKEVFIGAPKASLPSQAFNTTGAVYKCKIENEFCEYFSIDTETTKGHTKDHQMLGFSTALLPDEKFVACAPHYKAFDVSSNDYWLNGVCYWTNDFESGAATKIYALGDTNLQSTDIEPGKRAYYYMLGEQGFNVHIADSDEILMGAPGIFNWKGSVVRYKKNTPGGEINRQRRQSHDFDYSTSVVNPYNAKIADDSYLGYALASGWFDSEQPKRMLYVASAPQGNAQAGVVFLFDFVQVMTVTTMKVLQKFISTEIGEYFGYSLLAEDLNGDGYVDLAIGAPMFSKNNYFENGAVYIYLNEGKLKFADAFVLTTNYEFSGRFGTTIAKIGDINSDGYNDIAVGAPFEENGAVYIYHGGPRGIVAKHAQKITGPKSSSMFGHAISRGLDIDDNLFNDIVIGAPNSGAAYLYKSYPVVTLEATLKSNTDELTKNDKKIKFTACWKIVSKALLKEQRDMLIHLSTDSVGIVKWTENGLGAFKKNVTISNKAECYEFEASLQFEIADMFKPIEFTLSYHLINQDMTKKIFCSECVQIDPSRENVVQTKIPFNIGCHGTVCEPNLRLESSTQLNTTRFILGSSRILPLKYKISNSNEPAYLIKLRVSLASDAPIDFAVVPSNCKQSNVTLDCDVLVGNSLDQGQTTDFTVTLGMTQASGTSLIVHAEVVSSGKELNPSDNAVTNYIRLVEYSEIEINGKTNSPQLILKDITTETKVIHTIELYNNGPSIVEEGVINIFLPTTYNKLEIVDVESIEVTASYKNNPLEVVYYRKRVRRESEDNDETHDSMNVDELPAARTVPMTCKENERTALNCYTYNIAIRKFNMVKEPVHVVVTFKFVRDNLEKILSDLHDIVYVQTTLNVQNPSQESGVKIFPKYPSTVVYEKPSTSTPIWVYIVAAIIGIACLVGIVYVLYRYGFFRRHKKEQLQQEKRLTQVGQEMQPLNNANPGQEELVG